MSASYVCSLSGEQTCDPVVSKGGFVYDRKNIEARKSFPYNVLGEGGCSSQIKINSISILSLLSNFSLFNRH
jgi:hypothetical protein